MLSDKDENWLLRFTSAATRRLPGIQLHAIVIFVSASAADFSFPTRTFSWNVFPQGHFSPVDSLEMG